MAALYMQHSIPADGELFARAVREHWGIENCLHWRLDVTLKEDASRIRKGNGAAVMTTVRHMCMNLFQKEPSKSSLKRKQKKAAWDDNYRSKVLFA
jgi:predicted transposase YbfD/YdcC